MVIAYDHHHNQVGFPARLVSYRAPRHLESHNKVMAVVQMQLKDDNPLKCTGRKAEVWVGQLLSASEWEISSTERLTLYGPGRHPQWPDPERDVDGRLPPKIALRICMPNARPYEELRMGDCFTCRFGDTVRYLYVVFILKNVPRHGREWAVYTYASTQPPDTLTVEQDEGKMKEAIVPGSLPQWNGLFNYFFRGVEPIIPTSLSLSTYHNIRQVHIQQRVFNVMRSVQLWLVSHNFEYRKNVGPVYWWENMLGRKLKSVFS